MEFFKRTKGSLAENEDWWNLVFDDLTGEQKVTHTWHHMDPYRSKVTGDGSKSYTIQEFLESQSPDDAKEALKKALETKV
ncbi:MAG: hypothetical protein KC439_07325 [Yoonia sp.]|nr:hypothetical protein [Yoonia sp.]